MKPRILSAAVGAPYSHWMAPLFQQYFNLVEHSTDLRPGDLYYTHVWDDVAERWYHAGQKVIVDCLWELHAAKQVAQPCYIMSNPNWFWYNESLWYRHLGYHEYNPQPNWHKRALMPMRLQKPSRDLLFESLAPWLDEMIWSYQSQGRHLPNDKDPNDWNSQRYFNAEWYDNTAFSIVAESLVNTVASESVPFVTEKTFKPMAFWHPFLIFGQPGTLAYLRSQGFETFGNLFDESYDLELSWVKRCAAIVRTATHQCFDSRDELTQQKLAHNRDRFFDQKLVTQRIVTEILEPLLNYAET